MRRREPRLSLLINLRDEPAALARALAPFARHNINLTHIESRPAKQQRFDIFVDCEGRQDQPDIAAVIKELSGYALGLLVLDDRLVPWFPRQISDLDDIANGTLDAGSDLTADHPGFNDPVYRKRRADIDSLARAYRHGDEIPLVDYTEQEHRTWHEVYNTLQGLHTQHACSAYLAALSELERHCGFGAGQIPQGRDINNFLETRTGFRIRPVAGLLSSRDFLNGLAFRVFFSTQYVRHASTPLYTPEPDVCHELLGHAPMFADPAFADLSQEIGLASLGATDRDIERLARCYWHSVEFGLLREGGQLEGGQLKAYGAGLLSSFGELEYACGPSAGTPSSTASGTAAHKTSPPEIKPWEPMRAAEQDYPITDYQPLYFAAQSLHDAKNRMREFCRTLPRPFYARYNATTERIWVDRAVKREPAQ